MKHQNTRRYRVRGLALACGLIALAVPSSTEAGGLPVTHDAFGYRFCAGYFWSMEQCVVPQFRDAYRSAFMSMARVAATLEHKPIPLSEDEAVQNLASDLRGTWDPGHCQDARTLMNQFGDACVAILREGAD